MGATFFRRLRPLSSSLSLFWHEEEGTLIDEEEEKPIPCNTYASKTAFFLPRRKTPEPFSPPLIAFEKEKVEFKRLVF